MNRSIFVALCLTVAVAVSGVSMAAAQDIPDARTARKMLFSTRKGAVVVRVLVPELMSTIAPESIKNNAPYYSAIAVSRTEGYTGNAATLAMNFHSIEAADQFALEQCNSKRPEDETDCVILMEIVPAKYSEKRAFQLNGDATNAFKKKYRRGRSPKAFAISQSTGVWGYAVKSDSPASARAQAIADCAAKAENGVTDCQVVSEN